MDRIDRLLDGLFNQQEPFKSICYTQLKNMGYTNKTLLKLCLERDLIRRTNGTKNKKNTSRRNNSKLQ